MIISNEDIGELVHCLSHPYEFLNLTFQYSCKMIDGEAYACNLNFKKWQTKGSLIGVGGPSFYELLVLINE